MIIRPSLLTHRPCAPRIAAGLLVAAVVATLATPLCAAAEAVPPPARPGVAAPARPVTVKQTAHRAVDATNRGVQKAANATDRGVHKAIDATDRGVQKAIDATERGLEKASTAVEKAAEKTSAALSPRPPSATPPPPEPAAAQPAAP